MKSEYAVEITDLNKTYLGNANQPPKEALNNINLTIPTGSFFGLLGPNGAGKSTIIIIMAGLVIKSSGDVKVWYYDIEEQMRQARSSIGVVPQELNIDPFFSPREILEVQAGLFGVKKKESLQRAIDLGIAMQLTNIARDVVEDEKKNRIYLVKNSKDTLLDIKNIISEADSFYNSSFVSIKDIPFNCRFSIVVARRIYRQIGKKILEKKDIDSYRKAGKIYVSNFGKIIQTIFSLLDLIILFFIKPRKHEKENEYNLISEDIGLNERI